MGSDAGERVAGGLGLGAMHAGPGYARRLVGVWKMQADGRLCKVVFLQLLAGMWWWWWWAAGGRLPRMRGCSALCAFKKGGQGSPPKQGVWHEALGAGRAVGYGATTENLAEGPCKGFTGRRTCREVVRGAGGRLRHSCSSVAWRIGGA